MNIVQAVVVDLKTQGSRRMVKKNLPIEVYQTRGRGNNPSYYGSAGLLSMQEDSYTFVTTRFWPFGPPAYCSMDSCPTPAQDLFRVLVIVAWAVSDCND